MVVVGQPRTRIVELDTKVHLVRGTTGNPPSTQLLVHLYIFVPRVQTYKACHKLAGRVCTGEHALFFVGSAFRVLCSPLAPGCWLQGTCRLGREPKPPRGQQTSTHASTAYSSMAPVHAFASTCNPTAGVSAVSAYARTCSKFAVAATGRLAHGGWRDGAVGFWRGPVGRGGQGSN